MPWKTRLIALATAAMTVPAMTLAGCGSAAVSSEPGLTGSASPSVASSASAETATISPAPVASASDGGASPSQPPAAGSTSPAVSPSPHRTPEATMAEPFTLTSTAFHAGGSIPRMYTCDGQDVSPPLQWQGVPAEAHALALIVDDPDARGFIHWVAFDLTASSTGALPQAVSASPDAPSQGTNGFGRIGWGGPCPPSGTHRYRFTLYALDDLLGLTGVPRADQVRRAMEGHILGQAVLEASYRRGG